MNDLLVEWEIENQRDAHNLWVKLERVQNIGDEMAKEIDRLRKGYLTAMNELARVKAEIEGLRTEMGMSHFWRMGEEHIRKQMEDENVRNETESGKGQGGGDSE